MAYLAEDLPSALEKADSQIIQETHSWTLPQETTWKTEITVKPHNLVLLCTRKQTPPDRNECPGLGKHQTAESDH